MFKHLIVLAKMFGNQKLTFVPALIMTQKITIIGMYM